jgi:hypothetical protein
LVLTPVSSRKTRSAGALVWTASAKAALLSLSKGGGDVGARLLARPERLFF